MSSCTECHGMAGEKYDDHDSDHCPRLKTTPNTPIEDNSGKITCKKCGREDVPNWNGKGSCITCTRNEVLGTPNTPIDDKPQGPGRSSKRCEEPGCDREHSARGMCHMHYGQWERKQFALHPERRTAVSTPGRKSWDNMKVRCYNPKVKGYKNYGGRGIKVCDRWLHGENGMTGFQCFIADLGERPTPDHSLDRIDSNGDYTPENCCWATRREQVWNRRPELDSASGRRGVVRDGRKWRARVFIGDKEVNLGNFDNLDEAIKAREVAELKYYTESERRAGALDALLQFQKDTDGTNYIIMRDELAKRIARLTTRTKEREENNE